MNWCWWAWTVATTRSLYQITCTYDICASSRNRMENREAICICLVWLIFRRFSRIHRNADDLFSSISFHTIRSSRYMRVNTTYSHRITHICHLAIARYERTTESTSIGRSTACTQRLQNCVRIGCYVVQYVFGSENEVRTLAQFIAYMGEWVLLLL